MEAISHSTIKPVTQATSGVESVKVNRIVTHSGPFHCDDVFAVGLFKLLNPGAEIIRTREKTVLAEGGKDISTVLVDVGGEFNPASGVFDHHFVNAPTRSNGIPYASFGMVAEYLYPARVHNSEVFHQLITAIDSSDNGVKQDGWTLSKTVHKCNPIANQDFDGRFESLVEIARQIIKGVFEEEYSLEFAVGRLETHPLVVSWVKEHDAELEASSERVRKAFTQEGHLIVLDRYEPALMETAHASPLNKLFSVFPSPGGEWMVQQIPQSQGSFTGRKKLPSHWAGKRGEDLDALSSVEGSVFCHPGRFIAGNKTREGAIQMGEIAACTEDE